jgi:hypothetical protein
MKRSFGYKVQTILGIPSSEDTQRSFEENAPHSVWNEVGAIGIGINEVKGGRNSVLGWRKNFHTVQTDFGADLGSYSVDSGGSCLHQVPAQYNV